MDQTEFANLVVDSLAAIFAETCTVNLQDVRALEHEPTQAHILGGLFYLNEELQAREQARAQAIAELERTVQQMGKQHEELLRSRALNEELSAPVIRLGQGILMMPLIGALDALRGGLILERLLNAIKELRAGYVVLDVTGVTDIDQAVAHYFVRVATATRFLGSKVILAGATPHIARELAPLWGDSGEVQSARDVEAALKLCQPQRQSGR